MADYSKKTIRIYSVDGDKNCETVKKLLDSLSVSYVHLTFKSQPAIADNSRSPTLPLIFVGQKLIVGIHEFQQLAKDPTLLENFATPEATSSAVHESGTFDLVDEPVLLCIPDEYSHTVREMRKAKVLKSEKNPYQKAIDYFAGQVLFEFLMDSKNLSIPDALCRSQALIDGHVGHPLSTAEQIFDPKKTYQLQELDDGEVLNAGKTYCDVITAGEFNHRLVEILDPIYDHILSPNRKVVYLNRLECSAEFKQFLLFIREAQNIVFDGSTYDERLALFLNLFNIMIIHVVARHGPPVDVWQRRRFYYSLYYVIANHRFSLQAIFNGILRGNKKGLGMLWKPFAQIDSRLKWAMPNCNPLVHFAINGFTLHTCPIYTYDAQDPVAYIEMNTKAMLKTDKMIKIDPRKNVIMLSKIFKWYGSDFGEDLEEVLDWIYEKLDDKEKKKLFLQVYSSGKYTVEYLHYDWTINFEQEKQELARHYVTD
ncbi:hypothetical protein QR680_002699 [Steinernema hermaphroditum]|uniref:DUF547 domain-containing protein n=1 Tax=Steinernema hermaphroditum TaxID=289476 RepID=A0AA39H3Q5_9BILA|nr:hypothetical protein QR680_002699 [Steinernema hermaphroditum]